VRLSRPLIWHSAHQSQIIASKRPNQPARWYARPGRRTPPGGRPAQSQEKRTAATGHVRIGADYPLASFRSFRDRTNARSVAMNRAKFVGLADRLPTLRRQNFGVPLGRRVSTDPGRGPQATEGKLRHPFFKWLREDL
jgi:hypothetical protein